MPKTFTTFEVARFCGVFHTTVTNWVKKGKLRARVTPGGHRRIALEDLVPFMRKYDMPIPEGLDEMRRQVLVVDDEPLVVRTITRVLGLLPERPVVSHCDNGVEALVRIGKTLPDLVILDLCMPIMDGFQVCRVLRSSEITKAIRILAVSGKKLTPAQAKHLREHTDGFLAKPFSAEEFSQRVSSLLKG